MAPKGKTQKTKLAPTQAAKKELMRRRQIQAFKATSGALRDIDHPELKSGSALWVRKLRQESERRFRKAAKA